MEMEGSCVAVFPSIIVICFIHMAIVNNIPGMGRVFGGNLMGNWVSFAEIWEWLVTPQNLMTKTPLVKLMVEMDGSLRGGTDRKQLDTGKEQKLLEFTIGD